MSVGKNGVNVAKNGVNVGDNNSFSDAPLKKWRKKADQIVTLEKGRIIEHGTHRELTDLRGAYYHLVKNQLELGN